MKKAILYIILALTVFSFSYGIRQLKDAGLMQALFQPKIDIMQSEAVIVASQREDNKNVINEINNIFELKTNTIEDTKNRSDSIYFTEISAVTEYNENYQLTLVEDGVSTPKAQIVLSTGGDIRSNTDIKSRIEKLKKAFTVESFDIIITATVMGKRTASDVKKLISEHFSDLSVNYSEYEKKTYINYKVVQKI